MIISIIMINNGWSWLMMMLAASGSKQFHALKVFKMQMTRLRITQNHSHSKQRFSSPPNHDFKSCVLFSKPTIQLKHELFKQKHNTCSCCVGKWFCRPYLRGAMMSNVYNWNKMRCWWCCGCTTHFADFDWNSLFSQRFLRSQGEIGIRFGIRDQSAKEQKSISESFL